MYQVYNEWLFSKKNYAQDTNDNDPSDPYYCDRIVTIMSRLHLP